MRRFAIILMFAAFLLPTILPLLALGQDPDAGLPMCCRRNGKHHCMMSMAERSELAAQASKSPLWKAPHERCPYCPASVVSDHPSRFFATNVHLEHASFFDRPSGVVQTESRRRISRDRSRQKRGPPALSLT